MINNNFKFVAFCTSGLEGAVAIELKSLNYKITYSSSGRIFFTANFDDIPLLNMKLKSVDRIALLISEFQAETFDELYDNVYNSNLKEILERNAKITIQKVKVTNSKLSATGAIASVVKKAILNNIGGSNETGPEYPFLIILKDDKAYLLLDTTGKDGLHKRGYRLKTSKAPLRETIAAGFIILSRWNKDIPLFDPFCGSGTIPIEAATIDIPNVNRSYVSERWKTLKSTWEKSKIDLREINIAKANNNVLIYASDIDCKNIQIAQENFTRAKKVFNVDAKLEFRCIDFKKLEPFYEYSYVISNLPYGERLDMDILTDIKLLRQKFSNAKYYLLHPSEKFEKYFGKATKKFRFQNSGIWTYGYMYY